ncbi:MAG: Gfo/Idh/MocA family oxidoreductase [Oscillospiraceae bacterium]|nr:Gfo/Idh/MocA family oxidoreductase [Oscillospiraceae bacterium]
MAKLKVGIIGTGGIAHAHLNSYNAVGKDEVEVVAGCDIVPGKAEEFFKRNNMPDAKGFDSKEEMLKNVKLDAVSVCTYNATHSECAVFALENGLHVLLEKPMSVTLEQSLAMLKAEKESGLILTVGFHPRYDVNWQKIRQIIDSGVLGKIYYVQTGGGRRSGMPGGNFINKKTGGAGCLVDIGCYSLDFAMHSIGYPKPLTVSASSFDHLGKKHFGDAFEVDDFSAAFVRLEGGITLDFRMSWKMHMDTAGDFIFLGTEAGLKVKQPSLGTWGGAWDGPVGEVRLMQDILGKPVETLIPLDENHGSGLFEKKIRAFIDAVKNNKPAPIPTSEIIYNQGILDGIIRSASAGKEVDVVF